jgi:hypothetical protein
VLVVEEVTADAFTHSFVNVCVVRDAVEVAVIATDGATAEAHFKLRLPVGSSIKAYAYCAPDGEYLATIAWEAVGVRSSGSIFACNCKSVVTLAAAELGEVTAFPDAPERYKYGYPSNMRTVGSNESAELELPNVAFNKGPAVPSFLSI